MATADFKSWFFDVTSMSNSSGVWTVLLYSASLSSELAGGCMKAGLVMSSTHELPRFVVWEVWRQAHV